MLRKRVQFLIGAVFALSLMAVPAKALTIITPGANVNPVVDGELYRAAVSKLPGAFVDNYSFTYNSTLATTASAVEINLSPGLTGFSSLWMSWTGPGIVNQLFDVLAGAINVPLSLADGTGTYVLSIFGTANAGTGLYALELLAQGGANETPIPGAVLLFGSVLAGGVGLMRRRRSAAQAA